MFIATIVNQSRAAWMCSRARTFATQDAPADTGYATATSRAGDAVHAQHGLARVTRRRHPTNPSRALAASHAPIQLQNFRLPQTMKQVKAFTEM